MKEERDVEPRARILQAASALFRQHGFQAVGVDTIVEESGVAKMTLYRQFKSKDDLILEYLRLEDARFREWLRHATDHVDDPKGKLYAFFEALARRTSHEGCHGCPFQIAASEFPDQHHPALAAARAHKRVMRDRLATWVRDAGMKEAERTANQLYLLMEGSWVGARMGLEVRPTRDLVGAAILLIEGGLYAQAITGASSAARTNMD